MHLDDVVTFALRLYMSFLCYYSPISGRIAITHNNYTHTHTQRTHAAQITMVSSKARAWSYSLRPFTAFSFNFFPSNHFLFVILFLISNTCSKDASQTTVFGQEEARYVFAWMVDVDENVFRGHCQCLRAQPGCSQSLEMQDERSFSLTRI